MSFMRASSIRQGRNERIGNALLSVVGAEQAPR